ncbi:NAD(P)-binding protein [Nocardia sp. NPDC055053]
MLKDSSGQEFEHVDVLSIGAGLSGTGAACQIQRSSPWRRLVILEERNSSGGTWDLFRYPGVRSDSDMFTLGYRFRPWLGTNVIADGESVLKYLRDTAAEAGVDRKIRFGHRVVGADWWFPLCALTPVVWSASLRHSCSAVRDTIVMTTGIRHISLGRNSLPGQYCIRSIGRKALT